MNRIFTTAAATLVATPALAHHPLGGLPMATFRDGVLSGVGHPLLGFDHLFFIALVGVVALFTGLRFIAPLAYIAAMLVGTLVVSFGIVVPLTEAVVALSLLVLGSIALSGRAPASAVTLTLFAAFGLFHGAAFGGTIAAQEAGAGLTVLAGYLIGLGVTQYGVAVVVGWLFAAGFRVSGADAIQARLAGGVVAGAGALLTLEHLEEWVFAALNWSA